MPLRRLVRLLTVRRSRSLVLGAEALLAAAATTTTFPANYSYNHSGAFAQDADGSPNRLAGPSALKGARLHSSLASLRFVSRAGVAAEEGTTAARASEGIRPYSQQARVTAGHGGDIQAHHLIEKRFANVMGGNPGDWASIVTTRAEDQAFTNAWREAIPYGAATRAATRAQVEAAARSTYADYPEILGGLGLP